MAKEPDFLETRFLSETRTGATFEHPVTGQIYVYGGTRKRAWRLVSDIENRIYTGSNAPSQETENLKNGDLWWDSEFMELRVYHKLLLGQVDGEPTYSEGVWISSTHPMMDPDEPGKMKQFGKVIFTPPQRLILEGSEFKFKAHLPYNSVPFDEWEVSAVVSPPFFGTDPNNPNTVNKVFVDFDPDPATNKEGVINGSLVMGMFPLGEEVENKTLKATVTIQAKQGMDDEFYENFYSTITYGVLTGLVEPRPIHPPLIVNTLPFNERMDDTLRKHAQNIDLTDILYTDKLSKTIRFEQTSQSSDSALMLVSRIDGADIYDGIRYPDYDQAPVINIDVKTGSAKELNILFKYGDYDNQSLAPFYADTSDDDLYGVVRNENQNEFITTGNGNVASLINDYRIAFYFDGEDDQSVGKPSLWTQRFTDLGIVTQFTTQNPDGSSTTNTGLFIGLKLNSTNTEELKEVNGKRRLYFALINESTPQLGTALDIVSSSKGYIDIEPFAAS